MYGAVVGQAVTLGLPTGLDPKVKYSASVTATDTVTLTAFNTDLLASVVVGTQTFRINVFID